MRFSPMSQKELSEVNLIPEGYYQYRVIEAQDVKSQAGNDQIKLKVEVFADGKNRQVFDYLLEAMMHKIYHFCEANSMMDKYDDGTLCAQDCIGKSKGFVIIATQKDKKGVYPDKSVVKDYSLENPNAKNGSSLPSHLDTSNTPPFDDDQIPF